MSSSKRVALIFLVVIPTTCILSIGGLLAGGWLFFSEYTNGKLAQWSSLGTPPDKAIRIATLVPNWDDKTVEVFVSTISGKIYRHSGVRQKGWIEANMPEAHSYFVAPGCDRIPIAAFDSYLGALPSKAIDCSTIVWNWETIADESHFIILEDGSVWWWRDNSFDMILRFLCGGSIIGACLGLALCSILLHLRQFIRIRRD